MKIENKILKHYLENVYFITGTAYAGKSTTVKMLAKKFDMIFCGENYRSPVSDIVATPELQPDICYLKTFTDWKESINSQKIMINQRGADFSPLSERMTVKIREKKRVKKSQGILDYADIIKLFSQLRVEKHSRTKIFESVFYSLTLFV